METLLVFLAIAAIQMFAAYAKQRKEKAKRNASRPVPQAPAESSPIPDPYKELREALGLPPKEEQTDYESEEEEDIGEIEEIAENKLEGKAPNAYDDYNMPFKSITEKGNIEHRPQISADPPASAPAFNSPFPVSRLIDLSKAEQGILWTAILNEPRYKKKWSRK